MADPLNLATIRALLDSERQQREILSKLAEETSAILASFSEHISKESGLPAVPTKSLNLPQVARLAINTCQLMLSTLRNKLTTAEQEIEDLQRKNRELLADVERSKVFTPVAQPATMVMAETDQRSTSPVIMQLESPTQVAPLDIEITREDEVLILAGSSRLVRVEALSALCKTRLNITGMEFSAIFEHLVNHGLVETVVTTRKPPYGIVFPTLFRLTRRGLDAVRLITGQSAAIPEIDRLIEMGKGLTINEIPLLVFAVEEIMPRFGFEMVEYAPAIAIKANNEKPKHIFNPHVLLKTPSGSTAYVMYEGENFRSGANLDGYIDDYLIASNGNLYFLGLTGKISRLVKGHVEYLEQSKGPFQSKNFTNVFDLCAYEQAQKTGQGGLSATIWFVSLPEGMRK